jgi:glycosyltransferase involved in cell wall biosynthesis
MRKKKILLLSDDLRMTSGIATMSKEFVLGTVDKFDWVQLGSAINHPEMGKIVDLNQSVRDRTGIEDANVKIIPSNGYGDILTLRKLIELERPDAILHFTDPHYWQWLYDNEHEIRQQLPILYYHIWDNIPDPIYNRNYYESCDWLGCISKLTYGIVHRVGKSIENESYKPLEDWQISYVPHGINPEIFKPVDIDDEFKKKVLNNNDYDFVLFFNNRNIRRKQPSDVIVSFRKFCDSLPKEKSSKCLLLMKTTGIDQNGTDLFAVVNSICNEYDVKILEDKIEQEDLNKLYNLSDCTINIANNEGFGLATAESIMAGTPIIVNVTGGLQDQCGFYNIKTNKEINADEYIEIGSLNGEGNDKDIQLGWGEWAEPVWPCASNINGSPVTPYIYDDRVSNDEVANAIMKMYELGNEQRKINGQKGREWAIKNLSSKVMCDTMVDGIENAIKNFKPRERFNLYKV